MYAMKIRKIGNSYGVILPKTFLESRALSDGDTLYGVDGEQSSMVMTPHDPAYEEQMRIGEGVIARYRDMLAELAKR